MCPSRGPREKARKKIRKKEGRKKDASAEFGQSARGVSTTTSIICRATQKTTKTRTELARMGKGITTATKCHKMNENEAFP